jgi:hypothetical protein
LGDDPFVFGQLAYGRKNFLPEVPLFGFCGRTTATICEMFKVIDAVGGVLLSAGDAVAVGEHNAPEPTRKGPGVLELGELLVSSQKAFLGDVLGQVQITEPFEGLGEGQVLKPVYEFTKGGVPFFQGPINGLGLENKQFKGLHRCSRDDCTGSQRPL